MQVEKPRFFEWEHYRSEALTTLSQRDRGEHPVVIVGAGPVGLTLALTLAKHQIRVVVLEAKDQLSDNSRTLAVARRSVQIMDRLGVATPFTTHAITREFNYLFHGDRLIKQSTYGCNEQEKYPDISVLQQPWTEKILLDGVLASPMVDIRWKHAVIDIDTTAPLRPLLSVQAPDGTYQLHARYVVAADGARGQVRRSMGLKYEEIGDGVLARNFVICDFELQSDLPIARRLWVCPPYRPHSAVILHRQPFDTWRLDYALDDDEDLNEALQPDAVAKNIKAQLDLMGLPTDTFRLVWISSYRPMSRSLPSYRYESVFFVGDAAHQTPIFGGRGMNQGMLDAANLGWKLAFVLKGLSPDKLLDTYDSERRPLIVQNLHDIGLATLCMTAPTRGASRMRKAAFDLLPTESFVIPLIDAFNANKSECLDVRNHVNPDDAVPGNPLPDCRVTMRGKSTYLHDLLNPTAFTCFQFSATERIEDKSPSSTAVHESDVPTSIVVALGPTENAAAVFIDDAARQRLNANDGDWLLVRPDGYIHARLSKPSSQQIRQQYLHAIGRSADVTE